jgi:hypothetical protein
MKLRYLCVVVAGAVLSISCAQNLASIRIVNPEGSTAPEKCGMRPDESLSRDQALCVAKVSGLRSGVARWQVREYQDYVDVVNVTSRHPVERGVSVRIRRVGGSIFSMEPWEAVTVR